MPVGHALKDGNDVALYAREDDLGLGIAEARVELERLRAGLGQHDAGVQHALIAASLVGNALHGGQDDVVHDLLVQVGGQVGGGGDGTHSAGVRSLIAV